MYVPSEIEIVSGRRDGSGQPCHGRRAENATGYACSAGKALRYLDWEETGPGTRELLASLESGHGNGTMCLWQLLRERLSRGVAPVGDVGCLLPALGYIF